MERACGGDWMRKSKERQRVAKNRRRETKSEMGERGRVIGRDRQYRKKS